MKSADACSTSYFCRPLCEGLFPSRAHEDPSCLDDYRRKLNAGLRVQDDRVADERRLLHIACAAARTRLVFSYPRVDAWNRGRAYRRSMRWKSCAAAYGRLPDLRTFESMPATVRPRAWIGPRGGGVGSHRRCGIRFGRVGPHL